jgi:hypothetical protein
VFGEIGVLYTVARVFGEIGVLYTVAGIFVQEEIRRYWCKKC